jgi:SAM-dependent methyltransferase
MQSQPDNAREYYDQHSSAYVEKWSDLADAAQKPTNVYRRNMVGNLIELARIHDGARVVEVGAGTGLVLRELLTRTKPVVGTDVSIEMLRRAQQLLASEWRVEIVATLPAELTSADVYLLRDDVLTLGLPDGFFDAVLSMEVFRYVGDLERAFRNVRRVLGDDGVFAFTVTNLFSLGLFPLKYELRRVLRRVDLQEELAQYFVTEGGISRTLRRAGLEVVELRKLNCLTFNPVVRRVVRSGAGAERAIALDRRLEAVPGANKLFDTFLIGARKA